MQNLNIWKEKIKQKRKNTSFKDFLMQTASRLPIVYHNVNGLVSRYPKSDRINICHFNDFEEKRENLTNNGLEYDFSLDFFSNLKKLYKSIDSANLFQYYKNENCDYVDVVANSRNSYLSSVVITNCENIFYSFIVRNGCQNVFYGVFVNNNSSNIYFSKDVGESYNVFYSGFIKNSSNIWFSTNLVGCNECIFCDDLQNNSFYIKNKKYFKEEYFKEKEKILKNKSLFLDYFKKLNQIGKNINSSNVDGISIQNSFDVEKGYYVSNMKNAKNVLFVGSAEGNENFYDVFNAGSLGGNDFYAVQGAGQNANNLYCSVQIAGGLNVFYSYNLENCSYCLGCMGIRNKSYCILNKQYSKEQWLEKVSEIFSQMEKKGILGKFFPGDLNPFYFEDTIAGIIGGFSYDEIIKNQYLSRNDFKEDKKEINDFIKQEDISSYEGFDENGKWFIKKDIIGKNILDDYGKSYKLTSQEYIFLLKYDLPIPRLNYINAIKLNLGVT